MTSEEQARLMRAFRAAPSAFRVSEAAYERVVRESTVFDPEMTPGYFAAIAQSWPGWVAHPTLCPLLEEAAWAAWRHVRPLCRVVHAVASREAADASRIAVRVDTDAWKDLETFHGVAWEAEMVAGLRDTQILNVQALWYRGAASRPLEEGLAALQAPADVLCLYEPSMVDALVAALPHVSSPQDVGLLPGDTVTQDGARTVRLRCDPFAPTGTLLVYPAQHRPVLRVWSWFCVKDGEKDAAPQVESVVQLTWPEPPVYCAAEPRA